MNFDIPELQIILNELAELKNKITEKECCLKAEFYNDEQCWALKGGFSLATYRSNRYLQVKGGIPDCYVGGRKVWKRESVQEWLPLTDADLEQYHVKYKTGAKKR